MDFCEAAGFEYIPTFHMGESPQDMADFIEYAKGAADTAWGQARVRDGHPAPYQLKYLQLGNEERVDLEFAERFTALAKAIWAADPEITLVVGDFVYSKPIVDPIQFSGAASGITSLAGQQRILQVAKAANREVWFDLHDWTDAAELDESFQAMLTFQEALTKLADGAPFQVVVFEFNANSHGQRRALGNALAINAIERNGRIPIAISANGLQPDGQNDNGWDQGLLFFNPAKTWLQPPGHVTRMISQHFQPRLVQCEVSPVKQPLDINAKLSDDGGTLVMQVVNASAQQVEAVVELTGFAPRAPAAKVTELAAPLETVNTADATYTVTPQSHDWMHEWKHGKTKAAFAPHSVTIIRWQ